MTRRGGGWPLTQVKLSRLKAAVLILALAYQPDLGLGDGDLAVLAAPDEAATIIDT